MRNQNEDRELSILRRGQDIAYRLFMYGDKDAKNPIRPGDIRFYGAYNGFGDLIKEKQEERESQPE